MKKTIFEELDEVRIPAKGITGTIVDVSTGKNGVTYYTVQNDEWGDVDDPDAWNIGYAMFDCTAEQLVLVKRPEL